MRTPRSPRRRLRRATVAAGLTALLSTAVTPATAAPATAAPATAAPATAAPATAAPATAGTDCVPTWKLLDAPVSEGVVDVDVISRDDVRFSEQLEEGARSLRWDGRSLIENGPQLPVPPRTASLFQVGSGSFDATGGWSLVNLHGPFQPDGTGVLARLGRDGWTLTPAGVSQNPETGPSWLTDVATVDSAQAWAVGRTEGPAGGALIQRWDGTEWTAVDHPAARSASAALRSVKAVPGGGVWAAGFRKDEQTGKYQPLALHHDGTAWADVALPDPGAEGMLYAVDASGPDDVWVAGISGSQISPQPLLLHWDGRSWTGMPTPEPGPYGSEIFKLYAPAPGQLWALTNDSSQGVFHLEHWNGTAWQEALPQGEQPESFGFFFYDVDGSGPDDVWLTGTSNRTEPSDIGYPLLLPRRLIAHLSCGSE
ncbi:hypothetical protein [Nonomuraea gerenzanensis]|uniref:Secreted protein n=1 Tax=Nonomuraea gerenzanensis TaxID=93944 RepID=A0A1M4E9M3_9ACTN|nr:hypothetical protein [Nonomuraea gerenzanensis]UBU17849.1 hypothetical protein LCN96_23335 [Nonomuraea gerenzanensis]SBO95637.1 hypothetical protein BN4615_P5153 [Nonomuraea gerenzanensis]